MKAKLKMKCKACGHWNRINVEKRFMEQEISESKVKAFAPMYEPLKIEKCKKCKTIIGEPKELIRIVHDELK